MTIQFERRSDRPDATGRCTIHVRAYLEGERPRFATREKCLDAEWDVRRGRFRRSMPGYQEANDYLQSIEERLQATYRTLRTNGEPVTKEALKAALATMTGIGSSPAEDADAAPDLSKQPLVALFDEYRAALEARGMRFNTLKSVRTSRNYVAEFVAGVKGGVKVGTYDVAMHDRLLQFLRKEKKLPQNSVWKVVKHLKSLLAYLRDDRRVTLAVDAKSLKAEWEEVNKMYLTARELTALERAVLPVGLHHTRDAFLFCCYTGLRYSDLAELHQGNVHEWNGAQVLRLTQTKTRTGVSIFLTPPALAIIEKYADTRVRLLPVMANQVMNRNLKRVARLTGITAPVEVVTTEGGRVMKQQVPKWELVTMHTARHTFAVQSLVRGLPLAVLQKVLGHARIQTTMLYAKVVEDFQHHEMQRVWGSAVASLADTPMAVEAVEAVCEVRLAA